MVDVNELNRAPPGYPTGPEVPPDAYLHMIVSKRSGIKAPPVEKIDDDEVDPPEEVAYSNISFRDCTHEGCRCTDLVFLILYLIVLAATIGLIVFCAGNSSYVFPFTEYSEKCKVVCSLLDVPSGYDKKEAFECKGKDDPLKWSVKPRLEVEYIIEQNDALENCYSDCLRYDNSFENFASECVEESGNFSIIHYANSLKMNNKLIDCTLLGGRFTSIFLPVLLCSLVLTLLVFLLLRFFNWAFYWFLLIISLIGITGTSIYLLYLYLSEEQALHGFMTPTIVFIWLAFTLYCYFFLFSSVLKRMSKTVILLKFVDYEITGKVVAKVIVSMIITHLIYILTLFFLGILETVGRIRMRDYEFRYESINYKEVARSAVLFLYWWTCHLVIACQHLVIARIVTLRCLYGRHVTCGDTVKSLFRYHLGSACMGSFIFSTMSIFKDITESFLRVKSVGCNPCYPSAYDVDYPKAGTCFQPMTRVSYIPVCLFCEHFTPGGRKAAYLFFQRHLVNWRAAKHYLMIVHGFLVAAPIFVMTYLAEREVSLDDMSFMLALHMVFVYTLAQCVIGCFRMIIDSLFFSMCYDLALNDGTTRPYVTSQQFMAFVRDAPLPKAHFASVKMLKDKKKPDEADGDEPVRARRPSKVTPVKTTRTEPKKRKKEKTKKGPKKGKRKKSKVAPE